MSEAQSQRAARKLGEKIRQARVDRGLRQIDLAKLIGVSPQSISAFESGKISPAPEYLQDIAHHTNRPLHLFTGHKVAEAVARVDEMISELNELKLILTQIVEQDP
jgi:transcriptional regulator with XRE-family HTH domain